MTRPRVLIEDWLPIEELGIESRREREVASALPPLNFLHAWWARRPLAASAGTVLASLLPAWSAALADSVPGAQSLRSEEAYRQWVLRLVGVHGDAIRGAARVKAAKAAGGKRPPDKDLFGYERAYTNSPLSADLDLLHRILEATWGSLPTVLDPTAGGGSIPYVASRYGFPATANDLNQVAAAVLRGGVEIPASLGPDLTPDLAKWGQVLVDRLQARLLIHFPLEDAGEQVLGYIYARSVKCPRTGKDVPLSPNWWLANDAKTQTAVSLVTDVSGEDLQRPRFRIVSGDELKGSNPDVGSVAGGTGVSPWDGLAIDGDYIKAEAQAGRMGSILYAVATKTRLPGTARAGRGFRPPTETDLEAVSAVEQLVSESLSDWIRQGLVPGQDIPDGNKTSEPIRYGLTKWRDLFSARQLLVHAAFVEELRSLEDEVRGELPPHRADAVLGLLALMQGKALNWNAALSSWNVKAKGMRSVFDRHDFAFKWTFAEFDGGRALFPWCLEQLLDSYSGIARLLVPQDAGKLGEVDLRHPVPAPVLVMQGTAANLTRVASNTQTLVCIDPPYYDNVMYGELSDFFGVWEEHTVGRVWPDLMPGGLADVKNEAVANLARFADSGRRKRVLADADYEAKMQAIFSECNRVLRDDGVLTVMFTHKRAEAWDTLGMGLMEAGFTIETSWAVDTEKESSLNQAKKNAAASTIMLVCRKRRDTSQSHPFFEDLEADVRRAARNAASRFAASGIGGVDLLLSTYGPALSVISARWPVYSSEADSSGKSRLLRPEEALEIAREEVVRLQRFSLIGRDVDLDPISDFVLLAWSTFRAVEFPYDEARRLALAVGGLDVEDLVAAKIVTKKSGTVVLTGPKQRLRRRGDDKPGVRPDADSFAAPIIDAVHTVLYVADEDGLADAKSLIDRTGLSSDNRFLACLQGLVHAIPRTKDKGKWVRPEAGLLDALVTAYFPDIEVPEEWSGRLDFDA